jgi:hypothetical protein
MLNAIYIRSKYNLVVKNIYNVIHTLCTENSPEVKQPRLEADHSLVCNVTVKNEWNCNFISCHKPVCIERGQNCLPFRSYTHAQVKRANIAKLPIHKANK